MWMHLKRAVTTTVTLHLEMIQSVIVIPVVMQAPVNTVRF